MRKLVFKQSSPDYPISESRGGTLSVTNKKTKDKGQKSLCLILDDKVLPMLLKGCAIVSVSMVELNQH